MSEGMFVLELATHQRTESLRISSHWSEDAVYYWLDPAHIQCAASPGIIENPSELFTRMFSDGTSRLDFVFQRYRFKILDLQGSSTLN